MIQRRWAETLLISLSHARCRQDGPLHRGGDLLSIRPLFGDRPISKFPIELANRVLNDFCFDFLDHISPELDIRPRRLALNEKEISHGRVSWQTR
jgi:hypothetical protein